MQKLDFRNEYLKYGMEIRDSQWRNKNFKIPSLSRQSSVSMSNANITRNNFSKLRN